MFEFTKDKNVCLMLDMSKEKHTEEEINSIKERFLQIDKKTFFDLCHDHELDGVVGSFAINHQMDLIDEWLLEYNRQKEHLAFLKEKAKEICEIMDKNGIPMVVLKNGGIMMDMIEDTAKCPMEDIDSLIRKKDFYAAHNILTKNGFTFKFRSEHEFEQLDRAFRDGSTEYYIVTPKGEKMWFELAWRAVAGRWIRPDLEPDTNEFIDDSYCAPGTQVHVLAPEDNLLQVCIHTAKHSYVRAPGLRLHLDVERIVAHKDINWEVFLKKVKKAHVKTSTYFSLYIPSVIFDTPVPQWVLNELKPKNAMKIEKQLKKAGLLHPMERKFSKLEFLKFQTSLYDSVFDMFKVLYPGKTKMYEMYNYKNPLLTPYYIFMRGLDLVGIRKKK